MTRVSNEKAVPGPVACRTIHGFDDLLLLLSSRFHTRDFKVDLSSLYQQTIS